MISVLAEHAEPRNTDEIAPCSVRRMHVHVCSDDIKPKLHESALYSYT